MTTFIAFSYLVFYEVMKEELKLPSFLIHITIPWDVTEGAHIPDISKFELAVTLHNLLGTFLRVRANINFIMQTILTRR